MFHRVRMTRRARPEHVGACLSRCLDLVSRAEAALPELAARGVKAWEIVEIEGYIAHARRQTAQTDRRLLRGEAIPRAEKVFPVFGPHTRWTAKGKAGCPVELGVPVCVLEDRHGFVLHHEVMREGAQARFPDLRMVSSGRGFHSPANRVRPGALPGVNALPKKGCLSKAERERERGERVRGDAPPSPGRGPAVNSPGHRGPGRILARGPDGFARMAALSVLALNIRGIGLLLRRKAERHRKRAA